MSEEMKEYLKEITAKANLLDQLFKQNFILPGMIDKAIAELDEDDQLILEGWRG